MRAVTKAISSPGNLGNVRGSERANMAHGLLGALPDKLLDLAHLRG
jgi:hypothetical protein